MTASVENQGIDTRDIFAPIFFGFSCSLLLGGISILQAYIYFLGNSDGPLVQSVAGSMVVFDLASSALVAQSIYYYLIPHFGSLAPLSSVTIGLSVECLISTMITFISQMYFVYQIYSITKATRKWIIPGTTALFAFCAFVGGVACTTVMVVHKRAVFDNRHMSVNVFFGLAKGFGALTDVVATVAMCHFLTGSSKKFARTNSMLENLTRIIIHRGVLVTLIQVLLLITFFAAPKHMYWLPFHINVTKLYVNVFFAMLNSRRSMGRGDSSHERSTGASGVSTYQSSNHATYRGPSEPSSRHHEEDEDDLEMRYPGEKRRNLSDERTTPRRDNKPSGPEVAVTRTVVISEL